MTRTFQGIDHIIVMVNEIETSGEQFSRLGFQTGITQKHETHMGTHNKLVVLQNAYIELLGVHTPTEINAPMQMFMQGGDALSSIGLLTDNAENSRIALNARGLDAMPIMPFRQTIANSNEIAYVNIVQMPFNEKLGCLTFLCEYEKRELLMQPSHMVHDNGACEIVSLVMPTLDASALRSELAPLYGDENITQIKDYLKVETGNMLLYFCPPERMECHLGATINREARLPAAISITVDNLEKTKAVLEKNQVDIIVANKKRVVANPASSSGTFIEFIPRA